MVWRLIVPACASLALLSGAALAQAPKQSGAPDDNAQNSKDMSDQEIQQGPQKLRDKLAQDGYTDVKIAPGSYIVSARDKDGNKVVMMIGPNSMTMMKVPDQNPSQAQVPGAKDDEIIQQ
ncbi:MAG: PepSY domain-containing protein [Proteobacteria bacterium]|nr:PepSY domain-containing protein [Pseudomonadota bacterium]